MSKIPSTKQLHVLSNLERVIPRPYKLSIRHPMARHELDGKDCTGQVTALIVQKLVEVRIDGSLARANVSSLNDDEP